MEQAHNSTTWEEGRKSQGSIPKSLGRWDDRGDREGRRRHSRRRTDAEDGRVTVTISGASQTARVAYSRVQ